MRLGMWVGKKPTVAHLRQLLQPVLTGVKEHLGAAAAAARREYAYVSGSDSD